MKTNRWLLAVFCAGCMGCDVGATLGVSLSAQNNSGRTGTATLTEKEDNVLEVIMDLAGGSDTGDQPAHVHQGSCALPGEIVKVLSSVRNGSSITAVPSTRIADIRGMVINVHNSADSQINVACG